MAEVTPGRIHLMRVGFAALAFVVIFFHLLPLNTQVRSWAPPDLIICLAMAWSLRRPDYVPVLLLIPVLLIADLLFQRPPGLLTLLVVLGCEFLRARAQPQHETTFIAEWLSVALVITVITLLNRLTLSIFAIPRAPLSLSGSEMFATIASYPLVALFSQSLLGVRKLSAAEAEILEARK
ncbi:rod shape-determining protein MreD [Pseudophaeobacter sp. TrK17]|jgi:rod shape-determining protein MreD|uniref:rod shape-determining protein MreD n=1 Tax=Pseudophaeobacter sp. TrK17 TaxID=2815167 RepID=UPI0035CEBAB0